MGFSLTKMFTPPKSKSVWEAATAGSTGGWAAGAVGLAPVANAITTAALTVAAPFTGGASLAAIPITQAGFALSGVGSNPENAYAGINSIPAGENQVTANNNAYLQGDYGAITPLNSPSITSLSLPGGYNYDTSAAQISAALSNLQGQINNVSAPKKQTDYSGYFTLGIGAIIVIALIFFIMKKR